MALTYDRHSDPSSVPATAPSPVSGQCAVPKPLYSQVRDMLAHQISEGRWPPGTVLPNEAILAQTFHVSIGTIRRAVEGLEDIGIVVRQQGRGTFVAGLGLPAFAEKLSRLRNVHGGAIDMMPEILGATRRACTPAEILHFRPEGVSEVMEVRQTVVSDGRVIGIESCVLPVAVAGHLEAELVQDRNLYAVLGEDGTMVTRAEEKVSAVLADDGDGQALGVDVGAALLQIERRAFAIDGRLVELRTSRYVPSHASYVSLTS